MDEHIARANIDHVRNLLKAENDRAKRQTLLRLLAEEAVKLKAALEATPKS